MEPLPPPVQLVEVTEEELKKYNGTDPTKPPPHIALKGQIYDVSQSRMFYAPGGNYAVFAGKDASLALAKLSFDEKDLTGGISSLGPFELEALQDWEYKFMSKYVRVGTVLKPIVETEEASPSSAEPAAEAAKHAEAIPESDERDANPAEDGPSAVEETPASEFKHE